MSRKLPLPDADRKGEGGMERDGTGEQPEIVHVLFEKQIPMEWSN